MMRTIWLVAALLMGGVAVSGCAPVLGAGAAIAIDEAAERQGGNLF